MIQWTERTHVIAICFAKERSSLVSGHRGTPGARAKRMKVGLGTRESLSHLYANNVGKLINGQR